ncbi:MAG TPA: D-glycero-beta-D-manno-heptose 1-phosphate adenylyltransferase [Candidatus Cloacimonas sp.]|jgi:D-beta-D-heptose 7-phosphate kinase/D-beta-D-heptose 1-phosphate adenosyltransferase|nr:D-glycero-beta-D-manno-heptose 1-phosphate adenylyltransferase [Candidatus Cloacimonadota bacterium]HCX73328.1 D-glycero-beta-D-manno-heptose 1-phosphate adenylyltransferase [Candidatus Cloacimonas sp.]
MIVKNWQHLANLVKKAQQQNKKVVFTNGCFDILHAGHVQFLQEAKNLGDLLLVAVNSDASVKHLKGDKRPVVSENERCQVLDAMKMVDWVTVFQQDTPYQLIKTIKPDILVKGGDWQPSEIVGADIVQQNGGQVKSLSFKQGISTSKIIQRILKAYE